MEMEAFFAHCLRVNNGNEEEIFQMSMQDGEDEGIDQHEVEWNDWNLPDQPTENQHQANPDVPIDRPGDFSMYLGLNPAVPNAPPSQYANAERSHPPSQAGPRRVFVSGRASGIQPVNMRPVNRDET